MADLESAADELVRKIQSFDGEIEEAHGRFTNLKQEIADLSERLDQDWIDVARQVGELIGKAQEVRGNLQQGAAAAQSAVAQLDTAADAVASSVTSAYEQEENATTELGDSIRGQEDPTEQAVKQGIEDPLQELSDAAGEVQEALEKVLGDAQTFLEDEVASGLKTMAEEMEVHVSELKTTLTEECGHALQDAYDDWSSKLDEVLDLIDTECFAAAKDHAAEVVDWAMTQCAEAHEAEFDNLAEVVTVLDDALNALKDQIGECATDVGDEGQEALEGGQDETRQALDSAIEDLDTVKELLVSYSFVKV